MNLNEYSHVGENASCSSQELRVKEEIEILEITYGIKKNDDVKTKVLLEK